MKTPQHDTEIYTGSAKRTLVGDWFNLKVLDGVEVKAVCRLDQVSPH